METKNTSSLKGQVAIVTGGNSGIGFETARSLVADGATVVIAARNLSKAEPACDQIKSEFPNADVEVMSLDLSDIESIRTFAKNFSAKHATLNLLINNAGVMFPPFTKSAQGFELTFATNHLGHFALTGLLIDKLAPDARIVTVSSLAHRTGKIDFENLNGEKGYSTSKSYSQSKLANLVFTNELNRRLQKAKKKAIAVAAHPGWTITNLQVHTKVFTFLNPFFGQQPSQGCVPSLHAATAKGVKGGEYFGPKGFLEMKGKQAKPVSMIKSAKDEQIGKKLWEKSQELTGISFLDH